MRKLILFLTALGLGLGSTAGAKALDIAAFFKGVRLGERLQEIEAYYKPYRKKVQFMGHGGALSRQQDFDLRTDDDKIYARLRNMKAEDGRTFQFMEVAYKSWIERNAGFADETPARPPVEESSEPKVNL